MLSRQWALRHAHMGATLGPVKVNAGSCVLNDSWSYPA
jgi:hypothetical protein